MIALLLGCDTTKPVGGTEPEACVPAYEIPYDGVDQDCDGLDVTDVDGDGHDADVVGGEDCDDGDATINPDGTEVSASGADEDCDGRVDEYVVCGDGTGDFVTIQEGIDGVADGSTLELCAGTYTENVVMTARELTIEGVDVSEVVLTSPDPEDTVLFATDGTLGLRNVTLDACGRTGSGTSDYAYGVYTERMRAFNVDRVDHCGCQRAKLEVYAETVTSSSIRRSRFCDAAVTLWAAGYDFDACDLQIEQNVFQNCQVGVDAERATLRNNLFVDGTAIIALGTGSCYANGCPPTFTIENNTFADATNTAIGAWVTEIYSSMPEIHVTNNIFASLTAGDPSTSETGSGLWWTYWLAFEVHAPSEAAPASWTNNVVWDVSGDLAYFFTATFDAWESYETTSYSSTIEGDSLVVDPEFAPETSGEGAYALSVNSPARDAGTGADADGSPADIGAFGGENSDWWQEVPWLP